ncbi:hypothetical protein [Calidifontibacillus oryziterrae]|uniref:hypothetical protein n=1 Tax=Calidifontibacillus oryziterrae TaxID=1191699 RepID=UPI0003173C71|nr:hypothetical protein [Calidifontibacillus oryziterrae]
MKSKEITRQDLNNKAIENPNAITTQPTSNRSNFINRMEPLWQELYEKITEKLAT